jgi:hypothetical protein
MLPGCSDAYNSTRLTRESLHMMSSPQDSDVPVTSSPSDSRPIKNSPPDSSPLQTSPPNSRPLQIHSHDVRRVLFKRGEKFEWKKWGSLTTVSLHLKAHIITMPFFASRLDVHCTDCILCHGCFDTLPDYMKPHLKHWETGVGLFDTVKTTRTCRMCLPCEECSTANIEVLGDRHGAFHH